MHITRGDKGRAEVWSRRVIRDRKRLQEIRPKGEAINVPEVGNKRVVGRWRRGVGRSGEARLAVEIREVRGCNLI